MSRVLWLLLGLTAALPVNAAGFDSPEDAVRALEQAYIQKNVERVVAALDFVEEGRQLLQETDPASANDPETIRQTAELLEHAFREELLAKGFPEYSQMKCSFVGKAQIAPALIKLTERCLSPDGGKSTQDVLVMKRDTGWRVVLASPVF